MKMLNISPHGNLCGDPLFLVFPPHTQCNARVGGGGGRLRAVPEERGDAGQWGKGWQGGSNVLKAGKGEATFSKKIGGVRF